MESIKHQNNQILADNLLYLKQQMKLKTNVLSAPNILCLEEVTRSDATKSKNSWLRKSYPVILHYFTLIILGLLTWGLLWCAFGEEWRWDGRWFRLTIVVVIAWGSGEILQELTTLPPLMAALTTGILARHMGILDMRHYTHIDGFLRKIYPVIILGKGSLAWDFNYMKKNWRQVLTLGTVPWTIEVIVLAICTHFFLGFPWIWGFLLGSVYASVSCPVIMPLVQKHGKTANGTVNWPQLICTAGGVDTALSVGVYGVIFTFIFYDSTELYRYLKAILALFVGVAVGIGWGSLAKYMPSTDDLYVSELRVLFVLVGGLFASFFSTLVGWGGTGGVAVLACNATAANHWRQKGWKLNQNAASTAYRVMWSFCEPVLFAYTGTFFVVHKSITTTMLIGLGILFFCLSVRLGAAALMCRHLKPKERIFVCCAWIPKSIVEAVLSPLAINSILMSHGSHDHELVYANELMRLLVQAILITTPIGYLLTNHLGSILLSAPTHKQDDCENNISTVTRKFVEVQESEVVRL